MASNRPTAKSTSNKNGTDELWILYQKVWSQSDCTPHKTINKTKSTDNNGNYKAPPIQILRQTAKTNVSRDTPTREADNIPARTLYSRNEWQIAAPKIMSKTMERPHNMQVDQIHDDHYGLDTWSRKKIERKWQSLKWNNYTNVKNKMNA